MYQRLPFLFFLTRGLLLLHVISTPKYLVFVLELRESWKRVMNRIGTKVVQIWGELLLAYFFALSNKYKIIGYILAPSSCGIRERDHLPEASPFNCLLPSGRPRCLDWVLGPVSQIPSYYRRTARVDEIAFYVQLLKSCKKQISGCKTVRIQLIATL